MELQPGDIDPDNDLKVGSPEWRDAQDRSVDWLIDHPESWRFTITLDQKQVIASAYKAFQAEFGLDKYPDLQQIRLMVINVIPDMEDEAIADVMEREDQSAADVVRRTSGLGFWMDFNDDMPEVFKRQGSMHYELNMVWQDNKIQAILKELKLKYMDWETQELAMNIKSPSSLRRAANEMERLESNDYALYHNEIKDEVVEYLFRKGKIVEV